MARLHAEREVLGHTIRCIATGIINETSLNPKDPRADALQCYLGTRTKWLTNLSKKLKPSDQYSVEGLAYTVTDSARLGVIDSLLDGAKKLRRNYVRNLREYLLSEDSIAIDNRVVVQSDSMHHSDQSVGGKATAGLLISKGESPPASRNPHQKREHEDLADLSERADIVVVCALSNIELGAVLELRPDDWSEEPALEDDPTTYYRSAFQVADRDSPLSVVAAAPNKMGLSASAVLATKMIRRFRPRLVAMVGIAAGAKSSEQGFGDILAAEYTLDYGAGKITSSGKKESMIFRPDPSQNDVAPRLLQRLQAWKKTHPLDDIKHKWSGNPPQTSLQLHIGPLASGAAVIDHAGTAAEILERYRKVIGIEMEAYGVHCAAKEAIDPPPMYLCLKSICDFASHKEDGWQKYAAYTSAQAFYRFIVSQWSSLFPGSTDPTGRRSGSLEQRPKI